MKFIISQFYNEEFLLPRWLNHHKQFFDFGIMIDGPTSTDRSREIIKDICPNWVITDYIESKYYTLVSDKQILSYERELDGWRIALNTTEFLVGDVDSLMCDTDYPERNNSNDPRQRDYYIPVVQFIDWNPTGTIDPDKPLWKQFKNGVDYRQHFNYRASRSMHNHTHKNYVAGRHVWEKNTDDVLIFHYSNCISSPEMLKRRLQFQHNFSQHDINQGWGYRHYRRNLQSPIGLTEEDVRWQIDNEVINLNMLSDCSDLIDSMVDKMRSY